MYDVKLSLMYQTLMIVKRRFKDIQKNIKKLYDDIDDNKKQFVNEIALDIIELESIYNKSKKEFVGNKYEISVDLSSKIEKELDNVENMFGFNKGQQIIDIRVNDLNILKGILNV